MRWDAGPLAYTAVDLVWAPASATSAGNYGTTPAAGAMLLVDAMAGKVVELTGVGAGPLLFPGSGAAATTLAAPLVTVALAAAIVAAAGSRT